jgi:hypothetical protein
MGTKILYGLLTVLILSACTSDIRTPDINKSFDKIVLTNKSNRIVGEWLIGKTSSRGISSSCNACPKINFNDNGRSVVSFPDNTFGHYDWSIKEDTLTLQCTEQANTFPYFFGFKYKIAYYDKTDFTELTLTADSTIYFLRR